ncbi:hypothetical protein E1295_04635 [Nonomuraea mesophila]|uniref:Integral membrane protein n=1 Tax=Nonomuraea mesophila TaxID=2530382 RepID=A0A4R5FWW5_9ACTN|nr:hypothetical protein [Nonomuraea mesophila]TDE58888.1 hypothetical protein E1295_04635 [Nonomuraea mesophila]
MTSQAKPPSPVKSAAILLATFAALMLAAALVGAFLVHWALALVAVVVAFYGFSNTQGLWRGWRGARTISILSGVFLVLAGFANASSVSSDSGLVGVVAVGFGLVTIVLLIVPRSSRDWFSAGSGASTPRVR